MPLLPPSHKQPRARQHDPRPSAQSRGYDHRWQKARKAYLANNPICTACEVEGMVVAANVVDHITPHRGDDSLFWDSENWQPLCKRHHDQKTAREVNARKYGGGWGKS